MRFVRSRKAVVALGIAAVALVSAPQSAMAQHRTYPYAAVAVDFAFRGVPSLLPAGNYDTRFFNFGQAPHVMVNINLGQSCGGLTQSQLIAVFDEGEEAFAENCPDATFGGQVFAFGGEQARDTFTLTPGRNVFVCFVGRHYALGMISFTNVINVG